MLADAKTDRRSGLLPARAFLQQKTPRDFDLDRETLISIYNIPTFLTHYIFNADGGRERRRLDIKINT